MVVVLRRKIQHSWQSVDDICDKFMFSDFAHALIMELVGDTGHAQDSCVLHISIVGLRSVRRAEPVHAHGTLIDANLQSLDRQTRNPFQWTFF